MIKEAIIICTLEAVLTSVFGSEGLRPEDLLPSGAVFKRKNLTAHFRVNSDQPGADALQHLIVGSEKYGALDYAHGQNYEADYQIASAGLSPERLVDEGTRDNSVAQEGYRNDNDDVSDVRSFVVEMPQYFIPTNVEMQSHVTDYMNGIEDLEAHSQPSDVEVQTNLQIEPATREVSMQVSHITGTEYGSEVISQSSLLDSSDKPLAEPLTQPANPNIRPDGQYLPPKEPVPELPQTETPTPTAPTNESPVHPDGQYLPPKESVPELPQTESPTPATPTNEIPIHPESVQPTPTEETQAPYPTFPPTTTAPQPSQSQPTYVPIEVTQQPIQTESTDVPTHVPQQPSNPQPTYAPTEAPQHPHPEPTDTLTEVPQQTIQAQSTGVPFEHEPTHAPQQPIIPDKPHVPTEASEGPAISEEPYLPTEAPQQPIVPEQPYFPTQAPQEPFQPEEPYVPMGIPPQQPSLPDSTYLPPNRPAEPESKPRPTEPPQQPHEPGSYVPSLPEKPDNSYGPQFQLFTEESFVEVPVQYGPSSKDAIVHYVTHPSGGSSQYRDAYHHQDHAGHHHSPRRYYNGQIKQVEDRFGVSLDPYFDNNEPQATNRPYGPPGSTSAVNHRSILDFNFNPSDIYKAELVTRGRSADSYYKRNGVYRDSSYEYFLFA